MTARTSAARRSRIAGSGPSRGFVRTVAACVVALMLAAAVWAIVFPRALAPVPPVAAASATTFASLAELLTAFLLLGQFTISGTRTLAYVAGAYVFASLASLASLLVFPTLFGGGGGDDGVQASLWLAAAGHVGFAVAIAAAYLRDPLDRVRLAGGRATAHAVRIVLAASAAAFLAVAAALALLRPVLPELARADGFTVLFRRGVGPLEALAGIAAVAALAACRERASALRTGLIVVAAATSLGGALDMASIGPFSLPWYLARLETIVAASAVLGILLTEVTLLYARLASEANLDPLTGLGNRRSLSAHVHRAFDDGAAGASVALLLLDIDQFKAYNDRYGHHAGDAALRRVAAALGHAQRRSSDLVARYGGEEFVVLLRGLSAADAKGVAERLRGRVEALAIPHEASERGIVTVSVGVCFAPRVRHMDPAALFELADRALYRAKDGGRNLVVFAQPTTFYAERVASAARAHEIG